jgi:tetratricopeptide (TPR) repeat protein
MVQFHLSTAYHKIGDTYLAQGRNGDALDAYQKYRLIIQSIVDGDPGNAKWQRDLAAVYERIGDLLGQAGNYAEALGAIRKSLAISEKLAGGDLSTDSQRVLAIMNGKIGDLLMAQGQNAEALDALKSALATWHKLADSDAGNMQWQEGLATIYERIGVILRNRGELDEAVSTYEQLLIVIKKIVVHEPADAEWQRDLTLGYYNLGKVLFDLGRTDEALSSFNQAVQIGKAPDNSEIYWRRALAELYTNDAATAADDAATALKLKPAYPYYALWLHIARVRAGQNDVDEFAANASKVDRSGWPWPVVALFLGSMNPDEIRAAALSAGQQSTRVQQSCEVDFYIGAYETEKTQVDARPFFQSAMDHCPHDFVEYPTAKLELKRLEVLAGAQPK